MRYADNFCSYTETYEPEHIYTFTGLCVITKKPYSVKVKANELNSYRQGAYIQNALKSNSGDEREFLISGCSPEGFKIVCPE